MSGSTVTTMSKEKGKERKKSKAKRDKIKTKSTVTTMRQMANDNETIAKSEVDKSVESCDIW